MKVYKITMVVVDLDELGADGIVNQIESVEYVTLTHISSIVERDIGEWDDGHPLNSCDHEEVNAEVARLFGDS